MRADNDNSLPRTRAEAKAAGSKRYFTGTPCKHGHVADRLTSNRCCVVCSAERTKEWKAENPEHMREYRKSFYAENKDEVLANWADWYEKNREREIGKKRARYLKNRDAALDYAREYRERNPEKVKAATAKWRANNPEQVKEAWQKWYAENGKDRDAKKRSSPKGKLDSLMSRGIYDGLKSAKAGRKWECLVGYTIEDLMDHLARLFQPGMTWDNHGRYGWHIDHKIPKSAFNYEKPEDIDFQRCWALENLQPLWWQDNLRKHAKIDGVFQPSLLIATSDNRETPRKRKSHG